MKKRALFAILPVTLLTAILTSPAGAAEQAAPPVVMDPALVPAGTYVADREHSALVGKIRHGGLSHFVFRFKRFDARFTYDPAKPDTPHVEVIIDPTSIDTNVAGFDTDMATSDRHFNVTKFPEIRYVSNSLKRTGPDKGVMTGEMTFLGKTRPLAFDVTFLGVKKNRNGSTVGMAATAKFSRDEFGFAAGSDNLADEIVVSVEGDFLQQVR
jgi:polyisoprenoid-binding protein YceI